MKKMEHRDTELLTKNYRASKVQNWVQSPGLPALESMLLISYKWLPKYPLAVSIQRIKAILQSELVHTLYMNVYLKFYKITSSFLLWII